MPFPPGRGTVLTIDGPEPMKLGDAHPQRPPAAAAVDVEEVVASHSRLQSDAARSASEASTTAQSEHDRGGGESFACYPFCWRVAQASLCKTKVSPQLLEVRLKGGQGSPKVVGDRGVREPRDLQHTDQTLTLGKPSGPSGCLRGAGSTLRLGTSLRGGHAGRDASTMPTSEAGFAKRFRSVRKRDPMLPGRRYPRRVRSR